MGQIFRNDSNYGAMSSRDAQGSVRDQKLKRVIYFEVSKKNFVHSKNYCQFQNPQQFTALATKTCPKRVKIQFYTSLTKMRAAAKKDSTAR
jgi:hypothetical protein